MIVCGSLLTILLSGIISLFNKDNEKRSQLPKGAIVTGTTEEFHVLMAPDEELKQLIHGKLKEMENVVDEFKKTKKEMDKTIDAFSLIEREAKISSAKIKRQVIALRKLSAQKKALKYVNDNRYTKRGNNGNYYK